MIALNALPLGHRLLRRSDAHKGDSGKVLLIGGAPTMAGALVLAGRASLYSGAGYTVLLMLDAGAFAAQLFDPLFKADQALIGKAEYLAQASDKVLRLAHFVVRIGKLAHKAIGALQYFVFVERDCHRCCIPVDERRLLPF